MFGGCAMPAKRPYVYWDACVFIDYIQKEPSRIAILESIVEEARREQLLLVTSALSMAEVAFAEGERPPGSLSAAKLKTIDDLWEDRSMILLVEFSSVIAIEAREIIRQGFAEKRRIQASDAVHLATARNMGVADFHTYDKELLEWDGVWFPVRHPFTMRPLLPMSLSEDTRP